MFKNYRTVLPYIKRYRAKYIAGIAGLLIQVIASMVIPQWLKRAVDIMTLGVYEMHDVIKYAAAIVISIIFCLIGIFTSRYFFLRTSLAVSSELREKIFNHLIVLDWDFFQKNKIGDLMSRVSNDIPMVYQAIGTGFFSLVEAVLYAACSLVIIMSIEPRSALIIIPAIPLLIILMFLFSGLFAKRYARMQKAFAVMSGNAKETFYGINVVKSFVKENWFIKKFEQSSEEYRAANMGLAKVSSITMPALFFAGSALTIAVLFFGGRGVIAGNLSPGGLVALISYYSAVYWPAITFAQNISSLTRGNVSLSRINEIIYAEPRIKSGTFTGAENLPKGRIEFKSLSFFYDKAQDADREEQSSVNHDGKPPFKLSDVSFTVEPGEWLGILGKTGSGKSTLVKLIARLVDPPPGTVFIDGIDVREWDLSCLRRRLGFAIQDSFLFSDSVKGNIAYYKLNAETIRENNETGEINAEELEAMIELAALERDISILSGGVNTIIGERGITLSGGQKQRVAIARAALLDPEILVLDDSFSAVDMETERRILDGLSKYRANKTTVLVSHRTGVFRNVQKIAAFENGRLIEFGSKEELMKRGGYYARTAKFESGAGDKPHGLV